MPRKPRVSPVDAHSNHPVFFKTLLAKRGDFNFAKSRHYYFGLTF